MTDLLKLVASEKGIAVVFAVVLLSILMGWVPSPLLTAANTATTLLTDHVRETSETVRLLRVICRGVSRDPGPCDREPRWTR